MKFTEYYSALPSCILIAAVAILSSCGNMNNGDNENETIRIESKMNINSRSFGKIGETEIWLYELENNNGMKLSITNYGGIITSLYVPDRKGNSEDVVLGYDELDGYLDETPYFGAIVGRYGNRIAKGKFKLDEKVYKLAVNNGENHLHGGIKGFDKRVWAAEQFNDERGAGLRLKYTSEDMEEGYPGNLETLVTYTLTADNELIIEYEASTDKTCPVNLTNHSYFNLTAGKRDILAHEIRINAGRYVKINEALIPTGELPSVAGTAFDFLEPHEVGERMERVVGGYDHAYIFNKEAGSYEKVVEVYEPGSGRVLEMFTDEPAVQFYTGNFLDGSLSGKNGIVYNKHYGFCLEAEHYPDSPNHPEFPCTVLRPGEKYRQTTVYRFSVK